MTQRKQSYCCTDSVTVIFDGTKSFWKTRTNLDVLIVEHSRQMCIEIIAFNAILCSEAPRIYVSSLLLISKIDQEDVKTKLTERKEALIRMKKTVNVAQLTKEITVNLITQYILSRLSIPNDLPNDASFVILLPNTGDKCVEDTQVMDIIIEKPDTLVPLEVSYQKKVNAGDFQNVLDKLQSESVALKEATNMAELATTSVDGFKLMLAEKMRLEIEMRRRCTVPRLRWIKAINRVLVQNYCALVRVRLDRMAADELATRLELEAAIGMSKSGKKQRPKILRKSIDNSQLNKLPNLKSSFPVADGLMVSIPTREGASGSLPVLSPSSAAAAGAGSGGGSSGLTPLAAAAADRERRRARVTPTGGAKSERVTMTRKSFGNEHYPQYSSASHRVADSGGGHIPLGEDGAAATSPPSLIKSYNSISQKVLQPLVPLISPERGGEGGSRSIRIVNK